MAEKLEWTQSKFDSHSIVLKVDDHISTSIRQLDDKNFVINVMGDKTEQKFPDLNAAKSYTITKLKSKLLAAVSKLI